MNNYTFDIAVPVLNEEAVLRRDISTLYNFCMGRFNGHGRWKIVIADNGSTDSTREVAEGLAAEWAPVEYICVDRRGVGLALRSAWKNSTADIIGSMDLDLSTDLRHLPEALEAVADKGQDLVYATRLHEASRVKGRSLKRELISRSLNYIVRTYLGVSISDGMCGFTFFKRSLLETLVSHGAESDGWFFQAELLIVAERLGLNVFELPVDWSDDRNSKVRVFPLMIEYARAMRALKKRLAVTAR